MISTFLAIIIVGCIIGEPRCEKIGGVLFGIALVILLFSQCGK